MPDDVKLDPMGFVPVAPRSSSGLICGKNLSRLCYRSLLSHSEFRLVEGSLIKDSRVISTSKRLWIGFADTVGRRDGMEDAMVPFYLELLRCRSPSDSIRSS